MGEKWENLWVECNEVVIVYWVYHGTTDEQAVFIKMYYFDTVSKYEEAPLPF